MTDKVVTSPNVDCDHGLRVRYQNSKFADLVWYIDEILTDLVVTLTPSNIDCDHELNVRYQNSNFADLDRFGNTRMLINLVVTLSNIHEIRVRYQISEKITKTAKNLNSLFW